MKPIFFILILFMAFNGSLAAAPSPNEKLKKLRQQLDTASMPPTKGGYSAGVDAYLDLMKLGPAGFEVLANAWAYDQIPEENWLEWKWDFLKRYADSKGGNEAIDNAYTRHLEQKMEDDDKFAAASANRLAKIQIYTDEAIILTWFPGGLGSRRVGYMALKLRYHDIPAFDYQGNEAKRKQQLQNIDAFLKSKK